MPLLAAEAVRSRRSYVALLLERLELAERAREEKARRRVEQERLRIARDLHDAVAHALTTSNVQAGVAAHLLDRNRANARSALLTIEEASHDALDELRTIVGILREHDGERTPLDPADGCHPSMSTSGSRRVEAGARRFKRTTSGIGSALARMKGG